MASTTIKKLTDAKIKGLPKPKERSFLFEEGKGFGLRLEPSGRKSFILFYWYNGKKDGVTLGQYPKLSLADANARVAKIRQKLERGEDPKVEIKEVQRENRNFYTVGDLCAEYLERHAKVNKKSWKEDQRCLAREVLPIIGRKKAGDVKRKDLISILDSIVERGSPQMANRTLNVISKLFNFAVSRDILDTSPCAAIQMPAKKKQRSRVLSEDEIKRFLNYLDQSDVPRYCQLALKLILITGQRRGEVLGAEWVEVNIKEGWWTQPGTKTKNGLVHRVPLTKWAIEILNELREEQGGDNHSAYLFPSPRTGTHLDARGITRILRKTQNELNFDSSFTPHDLRRTAASQMTSMGIPRLTVGKILNHAESGVTAVYDRHSYDREKKEALVKWGKKIEQICGGK